MAKTADAAAIRRDIATLLRPPRRVRVSEAVAESMYVVHGNGTKTLWKPDKTPYMIEPMDCMGSRMYDAVIFVGPARTGKTIGLVDGFICYKIINDPGDGLVVQITEAKASEYSKKRLQRSFNASPELLKRLSPRGHDNNVHDIIFRAGNMLAIKHPSKNVFASSDYQFVLLTDYDRMTENVGGEGSGWVLASKRTQTFGSTGMTLVESSPGRPVLDADWQQPESEPHRSPPTTGILDLYNQGDRRRLYWQCPENGCRRWFQPIQENFNMLSARVFCPHCGNELDPNLKRELNLSARWVPEGCELTLDGELIGTRRETRIASFWMEGPAASDQTWASLLSKLNAAEETFQTTGNQKDLQSVINVDWGRPYVNRTPGTKRSGQRLKDRGEAYQHRTVPHGVRFLTAAVDVQGGKDRRFVVQVHGWGPNRETWLVDRFNIKEDRGPDGDQPPRHINPMTQPEDWDLLTRDVLKRTYKLADGSGRRMPVLAMGIDTGGEGKGTESVTSQAYEYYRRLVKDGLQSRVYLLKGGSTKTASRIRKTEPDNTGRKNRSSGARGDVPLYLLGTDTLKDTVAAMIDREEPGAGYLHTPDWLQLWWFDELTYEVRDPATGKWSRPGSKPNEAFDLFVYNLVVFILLKGEKIDWQAPPTWADHWDANLLVFTPDDPDADTAQPPKAAAAPAAKRRRKVVKPRI
ncbi:phage terminase large subunit family protein (plasmid) [Halomonas qaidamensis]|uniref:Phage terminase large subunit family protein n=1 Tax=Halomonas qaidamensis TaxID=2866211 RepID=A0ABY6JWN8_9GAMM|nr:phage terminase large subunit family protein [Halomonas qaidamensis]UYV20925.1 phage terminase large subunit family protein [Halomonas qaidamensis]